MSAPVATAPSNAATAAANAAAALLSQRQANSNYLQKTIRKVTVVQPSGGGITGAFVAGQTLNFYVPPANNGFLEALEFQCVFTVNYTANGAGPYINLNRAFPYNLISEIQVQYNGLQARVNPYFLMVYERLRRYLAPKTPGTVFSGAGSENTTLTADMIANNSTAPTTGVPQTVKVWFRLPLNALHPVDAAGMLPVMGEANPVQVVVICNPSINGVDPLLNPYSSNATTLTVTGTVKINAVYRDGATLWSPARMPLNLSGLPTAQWLIDNSWNILSAGSVQRGQVKTLLQHYIMLGIVIDGQQSTDFSTIGNITAMELDADATGNNKLEAYGLGTNIDIAEYFMWVRQTFGQDLPQGVVPWVVAPSLNQPNPSNRLGSQVLNMTPGGWTSVYQGYYLNAIGGTPGITPRVETWLVSANPAGLLLG